MPQFKSIIEEEVEEPSLKRGLSLYSLFSIGYADVGADAYIALGVTAMFAAGGTPLAFLIGSILYICIGLAYAELASTYPYAGGASVYAMMATNDLIGFLAGWLVMLDYVIDIALFSVAAAGYLGFVFPWLLKSSLPTPLGVSLSMIGIAAIAIIAGLVIVNYIGIKPSAALTVILVTGNLAILSMVLGLGYTTTWNFEKFVTNLAEIGGDFISEEVGYTGLLSVRFENFLYGLTLAMSSFIGIESIAQAAEEAEKPYKNLSKAAGISVIMVVVSVLSCSILGLGVLGWRGLAEAQFNPVAAIVERVPIIGSHAAMLVAIVAFAMTVASTNTGVIGVSRLVFSMGKFLLLPRWFYKVHPKFRTPTRSILMFSAIAIVVVLWGALQPNILVFISSLYNFGALLSYILVLLALIILRNDDRKTKRLYKAPGTIIVRRNGKIIELPILGIIGLIGIGSVWLLVVIYHTTARIMGFTWILIGLIIYSIYRRRINLSITSKFGREMLGIKENNNSN